VVSVWTCRGCGIEHTDTDQPPEVCAICSDERQFIPASGQRWTTQAELSHEGYRTTLEQLEENLYGLEVTPEFAIGQRGLLVKTPGGNLLWEPPGFLDAGLVSAVGELGGIAAVSASHPHLTGSSIQWSHAFGGVPVLVASADRQWIRRPDPVIELWAGAKEVVPGITMLQCGGHFAGSSVAHWPLGAGGRGALLTGDTIAIGADRASVNVMRSYVNRIPLPERAVRRILNTVAAYRYDRLYGAFGVLESGAAVTVSTSLERYIAWIRGDVPNEPDR